MTAALREPRLEPVQKGQLRQSAGYPGLQLEDFSTTDPQARAMDVSVEALARLRAEARAEGEAAAHDRQNAELIAALRDHAQAMAVARQDRAETNSQMRAAISLLLRKTAMKLLPIGESGRLVEALVEAATARQAEPEMRTVIHCPAHLHSPLRAAAKAAGLPEPVLETASESFIRTGAETTRIDLSDMQDRLFRLIDDYSAGGL